MLNPRKQKKKVFGRLFSIQLLQQLTSTSICVPSRGKTQYIAIKITITIAISSSILISIAMSSSSGISIVMSSSIEISILISSSIAISIAMCSSITISITIFQLVLQLV